MTDVTQLNVPRGTSRTTPKPRPAVERIQPYHPPLGDRSGLRLDFNENTYACSPQVAEALARITGAALTQYPERAPVEALIAEKLGLSPSQLLLTNGVDEAIHLLCQTWLDEHSEILLPVPTYSMYAIYAAATGARITTVLAGDAAQHTDFRFPYERVLAAIRPETRLIALANPNSPTGAAIPRAQILAIAQAAPNAIVLADEAYFHFHGETVLDAIGDPTEADPHRLPNLVVARTFSKAYGLAGLRLGLLAAGVEAMHWMRRVLSPYSVNALALACLPAALADDAYLSWYVDEVKSARSAFAAVLSTHGLRHWPSQANFVLVQIGPAHREFVRAMHDRGVLVRDRSADPGCDGLVRITIGTNEQMIETQAALAESLAAINWKPQSKEPQ